MGVAVAVVDEASTRRVVRTAALAGTAAGAALVYFAGIGGLVVLLTIVAALVAVAQQTLP